MSKSEKFLVIGATQYNMVMDENKSHSMADWFYVHYPHKTKDKGLMSEARKKAKNFVYEKNAKIYILL